MALCCHRQTRAFNLEDLDVKWLISPRRQHRLAWALAVCLPALSFAAGPPQTWTPRGSPTTQDLDGVAFGDGVFVAVGNGGTILTSPDGSAWTLRNSGASKRLRGITYNSAGRIFAAVGWGGTVLHSTDRGLTWTSNNVSAGTDLSAIAAGPVQGGGTRFVAIGSSRTVLAANSPVLPFSSVALPSSVPLSASLFAVAGTDQLGSATPMFLITGSAGLVLTSTDAQTWTPLSCGYTGNVTAVARQLGQNAVAMGDQSGAGGLTSKRLTVSGTSCTAGAAAMNAPVSGMTFGDGYGVAVGYATIQYSAQNNLSSWTAMASPQNADLHAVAYGNGSFVAVGAHGVIVQSSAGSTNPASWVGCYKDDESRALPVQLMAGGATPASCIAAAKARGFAYAGVQFGGACFGGQTLGYAKQDDTQCTQPCSAAPGEKCGGAWLNGVHATGLAPAAQPPLQYVGCFTDKPARALPVVLSQSGATKESCVASARARGLRYAGVQYGSQCFGGNTAGYVKESNDALCNAKCADGSLNRCGGEWHNSIFDTGVAAPPVLAAGSYKGCYRDSPSRMLPLMLMPSGATPARCVAAARALGLAFAGVQFEGQCFGGDLVTGVPDESQCNTKCTADQGQTCGGAWFNSVWSTR